MTIQEKAIEQLERVSRHLATIGEKEDYTEIAIQALEQEREDAVSRRAVLDIIKFEENWLFDAKSNNADTDIAFSGISAQVAKLSPVTKAVEPCEDCISREAVKNILPRQKFVSYEAYLSCVADVDKLQSVTPARKKGKWINRSSTNSCGIRYVASECSCCHKKTFFDCDQLVYRYCPNCGTEMREEE